MTEATPEIGRSSTTCRLRIGGGKAGGIGTWSSLSLCAAFLVRRMDVQRVNGCVSPPVGFVAVRWAVPAAAFRPLYWRAPGLATPALAPAAIAATPLALPGSPADVEGALEMIRQKFPEKRYPNVSLEQVCFVSPALPVVPVLPDCLRLQLVEGISNDVILSSLVSPAHFFLQQPTHPTFPALARLCACMDATYGGDVDTPAVPTVQAGIVVAAPVMGSWFRAEVVAAEPDADTCQVRYVDYGGYEVQQNSALRQIRSDFMTLPFQAAECYLANVVCNSEEEGWSTEALSAVDQLTAGQVLQAQVCGYCEDGVPAVSLYAVSGSQVVSVSQELVARGLAQWWEPTDG